MFEDILAQQNPHWNSSPETPWIKRSCFTKLLNYLKTRQVIAITGVRRAGKSTLIKHLIHFLIEQENVPSNNLLFFNLEHPYLSAYRDDSITLQRLYEDYLKMMQPKGMIYVLLDEVQFFRQWPIFVKAHHETKHIQFVITGSNAAMLSSDMATLLSGRSLPLEVFPFSLKELACSQKIPIYNLNVISQHTPKIRNLLDQLLEYGGFPIVATQPLNQTSFDILAAHARNVLLQDVAPRLGVRKPQDLEKLYVYLVSNINKLFSYSGLSKLSGLSDKSIKEYLQAFCDSYLIYELDLFSFSLKQQIRSQKKVYAIDPGQANAMGFNFTANRGRFLENLILIDLKRLGLDTYYFKDKTKKEVDFVVKNKSLMSLVQVTWDLNPSDTYRREVNSLLACMQELNCKKGLIIVAEPILYPSPTDKIMIIEAHKYLCLDEEKQLELLFS